MAVANFSLIRSGLLRPLYHGTHFTFVPFGRFCLSLGFILINVLIRAFTVVLRRWCVHWIVTTSILCGCFHSNISSFFLMQSCYNLTWIGKWRNCLKLQRISANSLQFVVTGSILTSHTSFVASGAWTSLTMSCIWSFTTWYPTSLFINWSIEMLWPRKGWCMSICYCPQELDLYTV